MSAIINFLRYEADDSPYASLYIHKEAAPDVTLPWLEEFLEHMALLDNNGLTDPEHLAAKLVGFYVIKQITKDQLEFKGLDIINPERPYATDYEYRIICAGGVPVVQWRKPSSEEYYHWRIG